MIKRTKLIDKFIILMGIFAIVLLLLFLYLKKIEQDMFNYNSYQYKIQKLAILDQKIENFFLVTHRFVNYDNITEVSDEFHEILAFFEQSNINHEFGEEVGDNLKRINQLFEKKHNIIEDFKSINSRLTSSLYYLFDLRKTILDDEISLWNRELLNKVFFQIGQLTIDININQDLLLKGLIELDSRVKSKYYKSFNTHARIFIKDTVSIRKLLVLNSKIQMMTTILEIDRSLLIRYNENSRKQTLITLIFFTLSFFILFLLFINYRKLVKASQELLAFRYAVENSDNTVMMTNVDREIVYVNDEFEKVTGYSKKEAIGSKPSILKSNMMSKKFYLNLNKTLHDGNKWQGELINKRKDGSLFYEKASIVPMFLHQELIGFLSIKLDVSDYIEQQKKLKRSATVFENTQDGILILNRDANILSSNKVFTRMSGYSLSELLNQTITLLNPTLNNIYSLWRGKILLEKSDKSTLPVWLTITAVYDKNKLINFIAIYTDLSEIIRTQEKADYLKYHDNLTLLANRSNFEREMENACTQENKQDLAIMLIELGRLDFINDSLGYTLGDRFLVNVSRLIYETIPQDTLLARWDGNKFILLLDMHKEEIENLVKKILNITSQTMILDAYSLQIELSIGISVYADKIEESKTLIDYANIAMYSAKEIGKNRFEFYTQEKYTNLQSRLNIEQELQHAIEKDEFILKYQPQYDIMTKKIVGVETLVRWNNKKLGWISPKDFISIAEENGMIIDIGFYIFKEACQAYMRWQAIGIELNVIAINISSIQFRDEHFLETIINIIEAVGISPSSIEIELTESYILEYSKSNLTILNALRKLGCHISIDDFGTGYSSLSYLKELPLDTVKIDKSFIDELCSNTHDKTVAQAIISLSHSLGYKVIAEGIETVEQESLLREYGCDIGQGFLFSPGLEEYQLIKLVLANKKENMSESIYYI